VEEDDQWQGTAGSIGWKIVAAAFAVPTGHRGPQGDRDRLRNDEQRRPPKNPAAPGPGWSEALVWAAVSGIAWRRPAGGGPGRRGDVEVR
jgi:hypothetical protein